MGFYLRKSVRVGPLRFNLSSSGVGVSTGIPGFRIGMGPRGNYVHMGAGGLYYRSTIPSGSTPAAQPRAPVTFGQSTTHAPLEAITSGCVSRMADSSSASLLAELNEKQKRTRVFPLAAVLSVVVLGGLFALQASPWLIGPVAVLLLVLVIGAHQMDQLSKSVVILYDFEPEMETAYQRVHDCVAEIARCGGRWHIDSHGHVYDPKYHGGAGKLVTRKRLSTGVAPPPDVKTNIATPSVPLGNKTLYFFPERLLVRDHNGVGAVSYDDLSIVINDKRFIEDESVPRDAQVVDQTWQYVNKNGSPDRRFNNNRQIPICLYEELWLNSPSGLNEVIQISRTGLGRRLDAASQHLADLVKKASAVPQIEPIHVAAMKQERMRQARQVDSGSEHTSPARAASNSQYLDVLLEILCCLMVADGRASTREKARIHDLMTRVQSPWSDSEIDDRIEEFLDRVQRDGYRRTQATALKNVELFRQIGKQDLLLKCLEIVAGADDKLTDLERQLCERVKAAVEEVPA